MDPNDIKRTSFCNKTVENIVSNTMKQYILKDMSNRSNICYNSRYAKIFNPQYKKNLSNPHIFCIKSCGSPYLLYCTRINNVPYCILIDKKVNKGHSFPKMFLIQYRFSDGLFDGSLFECELIRDNSNQWFLLIADIYYYKNKIQLKRIDIIDRINTIHNILESEYKDDEFCNICPIQVKRYFDIIDKDYVFDEFIPSLNYKTRGLYFIPMNVTYSNILFMFDDIVLKNIYKKKINTINFKLIKTMKPEVYELYLNGEDTLTKIDYAYIPNITISKYIKELTDKKGDIIVKCKLNKRYNKWQPIEETSDRMDHVNDLDII